MIQIRLTSDEVDLSGTPGELQQVRAGIEALIRNEETTLRIAANSAIDPAPYERTLRELRIERGGGPTKISVEEQTLLVSGADENLVRFSSWFDVEPEAESGTHNHFDYFPGNPHIDADSRSLVVTVLSGAQQTAARDRAKSAAREQ